MGLGNKYFILTLILRHTPIIFSEKNRGIIIIIIKNTKSRKNIYTQTHDKQVCFFKKTLLLTFYLLRF